MESISVGQYLLERLKQLGIKSVFGVPGDYELVLLDMLPKVGLDWIGNPNELNSSYAADGYGRVNGVGACITTFGPGEISTYCGIAGSYTESVPVACIVGYPPTTAMKDHLIMHHSLGDGQFGMYHKMAENITVATTVIDSTRLAAAEIDRVLNAMLTYSKPVYIGVAVDIAPQMIPASSLSIPLLIELEPNYKSLEDEIVSVISLNLRSLSKVAIIVDGMAVRNRVEPEAKRLIQAAKVPYFTTFMSKGFDESLGNFGGVYGGVASPKEVSDGVENAECVLWIGSYSSDFNTGEFTERVKPECIVDFQRHFVKLGSKSYPLKMKHLLVALAKEIEANPSDVSTNQVTWNPYPGDHPHANGSVTTWNKDVANHAPKLEPITQDYLWPALGRYFRAGDVITSETGTASYGIPVTNLTDKPGFRSMICQTVFGSIGFAAGSALGAFIAGKEAKTMNRGIIVTGEGSLQMTIQVFSDLMKYELGATVFVLNNNGYTIERLIHGPEEEYNCVQEWEYSKVGEFFGPKATSEGKFKYYSIRTPSDLDWLLEDEDFAVTNPKKGVTQLVDVFLDKMDAPESLKKVGAAIDEFNARTAT